jgi:hypothetical protein
MADLGLTQGHLAPTSRPPSRVRAKSSQSVDPSSIYLVSPCLVVGVYSELHICLVGHSALLLYTHTHTRKKEHILTIGADFPWASLGKAQVVDVGGGVGMSSAHPPFPSASSKQS